MCSGLSKAYGLPGLRIGWIVGPPEIAAQCWARHDYTSIAPGAISDRVAQFAVQPQNRRKLFDRDGIANQLLALLGYQGEPWLNHPDYALGTLVILAIWQFGSPMIIFLAGLRQIPQDLYEAASMDGASGWRQFWKITLPLLAPVIFFNLVLQTIEGFKAFTQAFIVSGGTGGPIDSTLFYSLYLYEEAFANFRMGYASALAWLLLVIIAIFTAIAFGTSKYWVYYEDESR